MILCHQGLSLSPSHHVTRKCKKSTYFDRQTLNKMCYEAALLPVRIHVAVVVMKLVPLVRLLEVGHGLSLTEVGGEAVIPDPGLVEIHLDQGQEDLGTEPFHLTVLHSRVEAGFGLADPHQIVKAAPRLEVIAAEVECVELVSSECPVLAVSDSALRNTE